MMKDFLVTLLGVLFFLTYDFGFSVYSQGPDYAIASKSIDADLAVELRALTKLRDEIAQERPKLSVETEEIAAELREKRRQSQLAGQERDALIHDLSSLAEEVRLWRDEANYIENLLTDFRRSFEAQLSLAEAENMRSLLLSSDVGGEAGLEAQLKLAEEAAARLRKMTGPRALSGSALDSEGVERNGTFVEAGPVSWFVEENKKIAGIIAQNRDLRSEVVQGTADAATVLAFSEGKNVDLVFDPTLGMAVALQQSEGSLLDHVRKGGFWIYPILIIACVATLSAMFKWFQLLGIRVFRPALLRKVVEAVSEGKMDEARVKLVRVKHPACQALRRAVEMDGASAEDVEEALYEEYLRAQPRLERGLSLIAIAAATAPLLGLLGTVTGMIHTFKLINIFGTGDAKSLSSGISEALVTTEFGLVVAIPALILHALLSRKISGILSAMEMASIAYVNGLKTNRKTKAEL